MNLDLIRELYNQSRLVWSTHCLERMGERDILISEVSEVINNGDIIEEYPDDYPYPSCLIFGHGNNERKLHVVVGYDGKQLYMITVYIPNLNKFEFDGKTRKA